MTGWCIEEYLAADYTLYNHFYNKFNQKLKDFGEQRMKTELEILNHANSNMKVK